MSETDQQFVAPAGHRIAYGTAGTGTPVMLIMGFATPATAWSRQIAGLQGRHQVAWLDNRGIGGSEAPRGRWHMGDFAADALALADHLGWPRFHLVGQSMGGMIAQHVALRARGRLLSLGLLATHGGGQGSKLPPLQAFPWLLLRGLPSPEVRVRAVAKLLFPNDFLAAGGLAELRADLLRDYGPPQPLPNVLRQLRAMRGHDTLPLLGQLQGLPTLILRPDRDILIDPRHSDRLHAALPGSQLHRIAEAGHGAIRQCADAVNRLLLDHFAAAEALGK